MEKTELVVVSLDRLLTIQFLAGILLATAAALALALVYIIKRHG